MNILKLGVISGQFIKILFILFASIFLVACNGNIHHKNNPELNKKLSTNDPDNIEYKGHYKVGKEYKIGKNVYNPCEVKSYKKIGHASWYGGKVHSRGKVTANGDSYNPELLTAAHKTLPMPSLVKVTNLANNKSVIVMVNDRGPFVKNREIDVSEKAAKLIGFHRQGTANVKIEYLPKATEEFLNNLKLKKREGYIAKEKVSYDKCSVNCHIKLMNLKYNKYGNINI